MRQFISHNCHEKAVWVSDDPDSSCMILTLPKLSTKFRSIWPTCFNQSVCAYLLIKSVAFTMNPVLLCTKKEKNKNRALTFSVCKP